MNTRASLGPHGPRSGFTLIELMVVIMLIGILSAIAIPNYYQSVETGNVQEAVELLNALHGAQQRYLQKYGKYCNGTAEFACAGFDVPAPTFKNFISPGQSGAGLGTPSWTMTVQRSVSTPFYGAYTITYDVEPAGTTYACAPGSGAIASSCQQLMPAAD